MACVCLHNYFRQTKNSLYTSQGFVDVELADSKIKEGKWRSQTMQDGCLKSRKPPNIGQRKIVANELWKNLKHFVNSKIGSVPWQLVYVRSVGETRGDK